MRITKKLKKDAKAQEIIHTHEATGRIVDHEVQDGIEEGEVAAGSYPSFSYSSAGKCATNLEHIWMLYQEMIDKGRRCHVVTSGDLCWLEVTNS